MSSKKEIWKKVDFKGKKPSVCYMVSNLGHFGVKNTDGKIEVRKFKPQNGVFRYNFKINGEQRTLFVHKEVAKAFLPKSSPKKSMLIHKDHNYLNDSAANLKWVTPEEHRQHVTFSPNAIRSRKKRAYTESPTSKVFNEKKAIEVKKCYLKSVIRLRKQRISKKKNRMDESMFVSTAQTPTMTSKKFVGPMVLPTDASPILHWDLPHFV